MKYVTKYTKEEERDGLYLEEKDGGEKENDEKNTEKRDGWRGSIGFSCKQAHDMRLINILGGVCMNDRCKTRSALWIEHHELSFPDPTLPSDMFCVWVHVVYLYCHNQPCNVNTNIFGIYILDHVITV